MYCAVTVSFNTVLVPSFMTMVESLVQVTVVAGPPVEIQVRVSCEVHLSISVNCVVVSATLTSPNKR